MRDGCTISNSSTCTSAPQDGAVNEVAWAADNVELTTVGIDIGSSTSHLMFARVHLQRLSTALSSRFVVIDRKILWQSPILLTPYRDDYTIDVDELAGFIGGSYAFAGIERENIDSGAVILTGEALKRRNARAIADLFSEQAGKFVCASAGHHMECQMAAHGSGAVALSRGHNATLLNIDIGGGTTKLALIENGRIVATCAIAVGGRLIVEDGKQRSHADRAAGRKSCQRARHRARARQAAGGGRPQAHRQSHGAHGHGPDRSASTG